MKISLCMIVKNEEDFIANCLDRALEIVDEAIIVDTGSTDNTMKILTENYENDKRVKVIEYEWENDFSKARNKSLEYASGDWILILDADERIFSQKEKLNNFLQNSEESVFIIPIYNIFDRGNYTISSTMIRLFRNINPVFKGAIHEQLELDGKRYVGSIIDENLCKIYHYGYSKSVVKKRDKQNRNMDIIKSEIEKDSDDPFHWYNKGVMEMFSKNYETAIDDFIKSHKLSKKIRMTFHNDLVVRVAQCMMALEDYKQATEFINKIVEDPYLKNIPDLYYYLGICYNNQKKHDLAIESFQKAIKVGEYRDGISLLGAGSFLPMLGWANVLAHKNQKKLAIEKYKEAVLNENNVDRLGLNELIRLLNEENMLDELEKVEEDIKNIERNISNNKQLKQMKNELKDNIQLLVEKGMLKEAKEAIKEYEKIIENDVDVYSIKGVIAMMEGNMDEAEEVFKKGLNIEPFNSDILYNIAYLYELQKNYIKAYKYYDRLLREEPEDDFFNEINSKLKELEDKEEIKNNIVLSKRINKMPIITIETWVYNVEKYLKECIESVLNQSFKDFEWVIIDNGSTDKSSEILESYSQKDKRIKLFKNSKNTFVYKEPMNPEFVKYTENLSTEYWCMLDSDDYLNRDFLKELYYAAEEYDADVVVGGTEMFNNENPNQKVLRCPPDFYTGNVISLGDIFMEIYGCFRPIWGKLFKVSVIKKQLEYNKINLKYLMKNGADTIFCIDFLKHCNSAVGISKPLYYYRMRKNSSYNSRIYKERYKEYIRIYEDSKNLLEGWNKLNDKNLYFITAVLYNTVKDCIDIVVNAERESLKDRVGVITTILEDKKLRQLLKHGDFFMTLLDDGLKALDSIVI